MLCVLAGAALLQKKSQPTFLPPADYKRAVIDRELCVSYYIYVSHECIDVTKNDHSRLLCRTCSPCNVRDEPTTSVANLSFVGEGRCT